MRFALRHSFPLFCVCALCYMCFFCEYSLVNILSLQAEENRLRHEKKELQDSLDSYNLRLEELDTDNATLERIARERMHMHKENEDLYLIK